jgi:hypothetical protein
MQKKIQISVLLDNNPGALAKLAKVMKTAKVNIEALAINDGVDHGVAKLVVCDPDAAAKALKKARIPFSTQKVLAVALPNKPGVLADVCAKLAAKGINIHYVYGSTCACGCDCKCECECSCECTLIVSADRAKAIKKLLG